jgi:hypothetical protein
MVVAAGCGGGSSPIAKVDWSATPPTSGVVVDGSVSVQASGEGGTFPLATIEEPAVGGDGYEVVGRVRYQGVADGGYLELWSVFPGGGRSFTRTLAGSGPLAALDGDSGWREFRLPFSLEGASSMPSRLELNIVLGSAGHVWVGPVELVGLDGAASDAWWSPRDAGIAGGIAGSVLGVAGAAIGLLASWGRGRRYVLAAMVALIAVGAGLLVAGAVAATGSQPWSVTGALVIPGAVMVGVVGGTFRNVRRTYAQAELRRIRALDAA